MTRAVPLLAALLGTACSREPASAGAAGIAPDVDVAALPAADVVAAVLAQCHGSLPGMDRVAVTVTLADGAQLQAFAALPARLRVQSAAGPLQLLRDDQALELRDGKASEPDAAAAARLRALATLIDAAALGPLHRATGCRRTGACTFELAQPAGEPWQLTLQPRALLVESLRGAGGEVRVLEHLHSPSTWIVRKAAIAPLGECTLRFENSSLDWDETVFAPPAATAPATATADEQRTLRVGDEARPTTPQLEPSKAMRWLVVDDPADWAQRAAVVQEQLRALRAAGQQLAGFVGFLCDGERARMVIGFRSKAGATFTAPPGCDVREIPAGRVLLVFPPSGSFEERAKAGAEQLRAALRDQGLAATGPICAQPYLHLEDGMPAAQRLASPVVRVSVNVR